MIWKHTKTFERLKLVKKIIAQLAVCDIILYFKKWYKMIDLRKQEAFDFDPKLFYYWRSERNYFGFFSRNSDRIMNLTCFNIYQYKMTQYNSVNLKLSNSQLKKSKSGIENGTAVTLNLWSNKVVDSNDETNFSPKLLRTDRQVSGLCKTFANNSSANIKLLYNI